MPASPAKAITPLKLADVHAGYRGKPVLKGLSLTIASGEAYALLGPNGAGKSTAARVACGIVRPERGSVAVLGECPGRGGRGGRHVGLAPQEVALFGALTIRENLTAVARLATASAHRPSRSSMETAVLAAMADTDCMERADDRVSLLSGGWRRRANLAAALVNRPALLVLDEPTEGVDARTRATLVAAVRNAVAGGAACLIISHDAAFVSLAADRVGVLADGRLIAEGPIDVLQSRTFGTHRLLTVRFPTRPSDSLARRLSAVGLERDHKEAGESLEWRRIGDDILDVAETLADAVDEGGGEMIIRRPGLDELLAKLLEQRE